MNFEHHYTRFPALKGYIERIGAEQLNCRRFMVKEYHGHYYVEKVLIKIMNDFSIECRMEKYAPTEEEARAIAEELKVADFPKYEKATLSQVEDLRGSDLIKGTLFTFLDSERKHVLMCQERREGDEGKYYIPWSMYASKDGQKIWESMEPDGDLPFWKPEKRRNKSIIMVHEGAKTAAHVDGLINDRTRSAEKKDYPKSWINHLEDCEHWGAIGGALAMHRCDFDELSKMKIESHLEYSCDADAAGEEASKVFSKNMSGKEVKIIRYPRSIFRPGWDLADPLPEELFDKNGKVKLRMEDMCRPATWATSAIPRVKGTTGPKPYVLTTKFREEWYHATDVDMFYHASMKGLEFDEKSFNTFVRPFSDVDDTARLVRTSITGKVDKPNYNPALPWGAYNQGEGKNLYFNKYVAPYFEEYSAAEAKRLDHSLLIKFFENLFPVEKDRHEAIKWCATLCVCLDIKMDYGLLVISVEQGVGKSTLGKLLTGIVGQQNTSQPNDKSIKEERNVWAGYVRLVIIPEIYAGQSSATYNALKSLITEKQIWFNQKFQAEHLVDNHCNIYANSNSRVPLRFDHTDRRWLVPKVTETKAPRSFFVEFNDYMDNCEGYRQARQFFKDFIAKHGHVLPGEEAPYTSAKQDMIAEGYSPGQERVLDALEWIAHPDYETKLNGQQSEMANVREAVRKGIPIIAMDKDGVEGIDRTVEDKSLERKVQKAAAVCSVARDVGFYVGPNRNNTRHFTRNARVLSLDEGLARTEIPLLVERIRAQEVLYARLGLLMEERGSL